MKSYAVKPRKTGRGAIQPHPVSPRRPRAVSAPARPAPSNRSNRVFLFALYAALVVGVGLFLAFVFAFLAGSGPMGGP